ncbi:hypothetical protein [Proteus hauseri]|uniref:hypothetical protein n=1 Tax=Proteus hauseri TaxID=183417 RepID=UPI00100A800A|nr:hypothetical protein [Proteus hauseri]
MTYIYSIILHYFLMLLGQSWGNIIVSLSLSIDVFFAPIMDILIKASGDSYDSVFIFMIVALAASAIVM